MGIGGADSFYEDYSFIRKSYLFGCVYEWITSNIQAVMVPKTLKILHTCKNRYLCNMTTALSALKYKQTTVNGAFFMEPKIFCIFYLLQ